MSGVRDSFSGLIPGQKAKKKSKTQQHWDEFNKQCTLSKTQVGRAPRGTLSRFPPLAPFPH